jgi:multisubunit Na+/H+ antiporter MnhB subunit
VNVGDAFDILLCVLVLVVATAAIAGRQLFTGVALFVVYGLLLAIAWVRLGAVNVALAEAAIGAGLTGVLLLGAVARLEGTSKQGLSLRPLPVALCASIGIGLAWTAAGMMVPDAGLRPLVEENLALSGAENQVTAVLLNFRSWDTLLETVVLFVALIGVWSLGEDEYWGGRPGLRQHVRKEGVLATFGRFLPPIGVVIGIYLVWIGTSAPGGAFQAGTVLAAAWLLAMMAGLGEPPRVSNKLLGWGLAAGALIFLSAGYLGIVHGGFLVYPQTVAKQMILAIELALALSIALTLSLLVLGPARRPQ